MTHYISMFLLAVWFTCVSLHITVIQPSKNPSRSDYLKVNFASATNTCYSSEAIIIYWPVNMAWSLT